MAKTNLNVVKDETAPVEAIAKPGKFSLSKFKSKRGSAIANVATLPSALVEHTISAARDFVRLHPDEDYFSGELCFIKVPIQGQRHGHLHLIDEDLAMEFLRESEIIRQGLNLASKPGDAFFLCIVPTQNLENTWNKTNLAACEQAKTRWTKALSRKKEGGEEYEITFARDADSFAAPKWPSQTLDELITIAFNGRQIEDANHPALLRKIGARQTLA